MDPVSEEHEHARQRLASELRRLKERSGMSFAAVAAKTYCSKSSLERYLNGKLVPPREVVLAVAGVCDGDQDELSALWRAAIGEASETPARTRRETVDVPVRHIERTVAPAGEAGAQQPVEPLAEPPGEGLVPRRSPTARLRGPVGGFVAGVLVAAALAVLVAQSRQEQTAGRSRPADEGCDHPQVCFYRGDGVTGRFTRITEYWQPLTRSRDAEALVNTRRDGVVWLWWNDGPAACVPPLRTVRLTTRQPLEATRVAAQRTCPDRGADRPDRLQVADMPEPHPRVAN